MMVDPIINSGTQPTETAERPAPGFEQAIECALQKESEADNALNPTPPKTKNVSGVPSSSDDPKLDDAAAVAVALLFLAVPAPQPTTEAPVALAPPPLKALTVTEPTATAVQPAETTPSIPSTPPALLVSDVQDATQAAMEVKAVPDPHQSQSTPPPEPSGDRELEERESGPQSATSRETPNNVETAPLSAPPKIDLNPAPPTPGAHKIFTNHGLEKAQSRTPKKTDSPAPKTELPFPIDPGLQVEADDASISEVKLSSEPSTASLPLTNASRKPSPNEALPNPNTHRSDKPEPAQAPPVPLSTAKTPAQPQPHAQGDRVHSYNLVDSHIVPMKEPASAGLVSFTPGDPKIILPEATRHTESPQPVKPAEIQLSDSPVPGAVHLLAQPAHQEMKFSWNTPDFGHIEVRTTVDHDRVGALVSAPDANLRESLRSQLESLNHALGQHSLELGDFHTSDSGANNDSRNSNEPKLSETPPENPFPGARVHAPVLHAIEAMHVGTLDLRA